MTPYYIFSSACIPAIGGHLWCLDCDVILPNESLSFFEILSQSDEHLSDGGGPGAKAARSRPAPRAHARR